MLVSLPTFGSLLPITGRVLLPAPGKLGFPGKGRRLLPNPGPVDGRVAGSLLFVPTLGGVVGLVEGRLLSLGKGAGFEFPKLGRVNPGFGAGAGAGRVGLEREGFVVGVGELGRELFGNVGFTAGLLGFEVETPPPSDGREPPNVGLLGFTVGRDGAGRDVAFPIDGRCCELGREGLGRLTLGRGVLGLVAGLEALGEGRETLGRVPPPPTLPIDGRDPPRPPFCA